MTALRAVRFALVRARLTDCGRDGMGVRRPLNGLRAWRGGLRADVVYSPSPSPSHRHRCRRRRRCVFFAILLVCKHHSFFQTPTFL